jgi:hypothetical protein
VVWEWFRSAGGVLRSVKGVLRVAKHISISISIYLSSCVGCVSSRCSCESSGLVGI